MINWLSITTPKEVGGSGPKKNERDEYINASQNGLGRVDLHPQVFLSGQHP